MSSCMLRMLTLSTRQMRQVPCLSTATLGTSTLPPSLPVLVVEVPMPSSQPLSERPPSLLACVAVEVPMPQPSHSRKRPSSFPVNTIQQQVDTHCIVVVTII